jgi:hypothetical protein
MVCLLASSAARMNDAATSAALVVGSLTSSGMTPTTGTWTPVDGAGAVGCGVVVEVVVVGVLVVGVGACAGCWVVTGVALVGGGGGVTGCWVAQPVTTALLMTTHRHLAKSHTHQIVCSIRKTEPQPEKSCLGVLRAAKQGCLFAGNLNMGMPIVYPTSISVPTKLPKVPHEQIVRLIDLHKSRSRWSVCPDGQDLRLQLYETFVSKHKCCALTVCLTRFRRKQNNAAER